MRSASYPHPVCRSLYACLKFIIFAVRFLCRSSQSFIENGHNCSLFHIVNCCTYFNGAITVWISGCFLFDFVNEKWKWIAGFRAIFARFKHFRTTSTFGAYSWLPENAIRSFHGQCGITNANHTVRTRIFVANNTMILMGYTYVHRLRRVHVNEYSMNMHYVEQYILDLIHQVFQFSVSWTA